MKKTAAGNYTTPDGFRVTVDREDDFPYRVFDSLQRVRILGKTLEWSKAQIRVLRRERTRRAKIDPDFAEKLAEAKKRRRKVTRKRKPIDDQIRIASEKVVEWKRKQRLASTKLDQWEKKLRSAEKRKIAVLEKELAKPARRRFRFDG